jgi:hypothetical protein
VCYYVDISVTQFWVLYSLCYYQSSAHKLYVTAIFPVTYFTMCYMIMLPKLCPAVVGGGSNQGPSPVTAAEQRVSYGGIEQITVGRPSHWWSSARTPSSPRPFRGAGPDLKRPMECWNIRSNFVFHIRFQIFPINLKAYIVAVHVSLSPNWWKLSREWQKVKTLVPH